MYELNKVSLNDVRERLLQPRYLLLLETGDDLFVALRVKRQHVSKITYNFVKDYSGFLPLAPIGTTPVSGVTQSSFSQHNAIQIQEIGNLQDALSIPTPRQNNLLQIFYGIAPSYCFVTPEQPGGTLLAQLPNTSEFPSASYPWIYDHSGFDSPFYMPSQDTELFSIANVTLQFTLANTVPIPISPKLMFIINNLTVEPISSLDTFRKMIEGTIPRRVVSMGQIYSNVTWSSQVYSGIQPVSASNILGSNGAAYFRDAGYGGD
jgi:hypothetical protein